MADVDGDVLRGERGPDGLGRDSAGVVDHEAAAPEGERVRVTDLGERDSLLSQDQLQARRRLPQEEGERRQVQ